MISNYIEVQVSCEKIDVEIVLAFLNLFPFESFEEKTSSIHGYMKRADLPEKLEERLSQIIPVPVQIEMVDVPDINWNAAWESNFKPVQIGNFCGIRADFHEAFIGLEHEIIINPKMSFGTGHHETSYMMLEAMKNLDISESPVLDFGCGTGILSILAEKLGACEITSVDIDDNALENCIENVTTNRCTKINVSNTQISSFNSETFNLILANVNLTVLLDMASEFKRIIKNKKRVLLSGIMQDDRTKIETRYKELGFRVEHVFSKGDWLCFQFIIDKQFNSDSGAYHL